MSTFLGKNHLKKSLTIIFLIVLFLVPYDNLYCAKVYEGAKIRVTTMGKEYRGNLLSVTEDLIVIREKNSGGLLGFSIGDVDKVKVGKKSRAGKGILIGAGIGVIIAGGLLLIVPKKGDSFGEAIGSVLLVGAAITAGIIILGVLGLGGGIIGALFGKGKTMKIGRMDESKRMKALQKLTEYALYGPVIPEEIKPQLSIVGRN